MLQERRRNDHVSENYKGDIMGSTRYNQTKEHANIIIDSSSELRSISVVSTTDFITVLACRYGAALAN